MTRFRKKENLRLKRCKVNIATDCKVLFRTPKKRPRSCNKCKEVLKKLGISAEKYVYLSRRKKMEKITEKMIWDNPDKGTMTIERETAVVQDDKVVGNRVTTSTIAATYEDIAGGLQVVADRINKTMKDVATKKEHLVILGEITDLSPELLKLQADMMEITRITTGKKLINDLAPLMEDLKTDQEWYAARMATLKTRPTPNNDDKECNCKEDEACSECPKEEPKVNKNV